MLCFLNQISFVFFPCTSEITTSLTRIVRNAGEFCSLIISNAKAKSKLHIQFHVLNTNRYYAIDDQKKNREIRLHIRAKILQMGLCVRYCGV